MIFAERLRSVDVHRIPQGCGRAILANITEFGQTPLYTREELAAAVWTLFFTAARLSRHERAGAEVYEAIRSEGTSELVG